MGAMGREPDVKPPSPRDEVWVPAIRIAATSRVELLSPVLAQ